MSEIVPESTRKLVIYCDFATPDLSEEAFMEGVTDSAMIDEPELRKNIRNQRGKHAKLQGQVHSESFFVMFRESVLEEEACVLPIEGSKGVNGAVSARTWH